MLLVYIAKHLLSELLKSVNMALKNTSSQSIKSRHRQCEATQQSGFNATCSL